MHNIHNLEQRWLRYKIKSYMPLIIIVVFSVILIVTLYLILSSKKTSDLDTKDELKKEKQTKEKVLKEKNTTKSEKTKVEKSDTTKKPADKIHDVVSKNVDRLENNEKIILTPSFDFMKKLRTESIHSYDMQDTDRSHSEQNSDTIEQEQNSDTIEQEQENTHSTDEKKQKAQISISRKEDRNDLKDVIKRFKKNNNPALSLFIAKKYYKFGDYEKAYNYSLMTNEINNDIEESWIIFAKSLVKLNKREKAIKTLTRYVNHSGSGNAKVLLDNIKSGKFK